ncbi:MAG: FkbM family methyltransferase [Actinomycetota bacterium]
MKLLPLHGRRVFELPWGRMELALDDLPQREMAFGAFERSEVAIARRWIPEGGVALDVGAHVGFYTVLFASLVGPTGRVIGVEPVSFNFAALERNVNLNEFGWVDLVHAAASDHTGTGQLSTQTGQTALGSLDLQREGTAIDVPLVRLDEYLRDRGVDHLTFVKIDVEGHERAVLRGIEDLLGPADGPVLMVEMLPGREEIWAEIIRWLERLGYEPTYLRDRAGQLRPNAFFFKRSHLSAE